MAANVHLHMLPPSVNNMTVRVFLRAAGIEHTEENAWGKTRSPEYMAKVPSHLTPAIEIDGHPRGAMWESCAICMYLSNVYHVDKLYPTDPNRRALVDSANFFLTATLYPLVARAAYPRLGFPSYPGEVAAHHDATDAQKHAARAAAEEALSGPLEVFRSYFVRDGFIGDGDGPSIADIRFASTLEFMALMDRPLPEWASAYRERVENALGEAYSSVAGEVRGFIAHVKSKA